MGNSGGPIIVAAAILGACIVGATFVLSGSIDRVSEGVASLQASTNAIRTAIEGSGARPAQQAAAPQRRSGRSASRR